MYIRDCDVMYIAKTYYNVTPERGAIHPEEGYVDKNFAFGDIHDEDAYYVLKIVNKDESRPELTDIIDQVIENFYNYCSENEDSLLIRGAKLVRTTTNTLSTYADVRHWTESGSIETIRCNIKLTEDYHGVWMNDFLNSGDDHSVEELSLDMGKICGQLSEFLATEQHLSARLREARGEHFRWQVSTCDQLIESNLRILFPQGGDGLDEVQSLQWKLTNQVLYEYRSSSKAKIQQLPECILHSDLSTSNIIIDDCVPNQTKYCIIDFADLQVGPRCAELAHSMLYNLLEQTFSTMGQSIKMIPKWVYKGYHSNPGCSIDENELQMIPSLMKLRLCLSLTNGLVAIRQDPENDHVMRSNKLGGWKILQLLMSYDQLELVDWWKQDAV